MSAADKRAKGPAPTHMKRPHHHHLVREAAPRNWSKADRGAVYHAQNLARKHKLDVDRDPRNFVWAENGRGAHTRENARFIRDVLSKADKKGKFFEALEALGNNASDSKFLRSIDIDKL